MRILNDYKDISRKNLSVLFLELVSMELSCMDTVGI